VRWARPFITQNWAAKRRPAKKPSQRRTQGWTTHPSQSLLPHVPWITSTAKLSASFAPLSRPPLCALGSASGVKLKKALGHSFANHSFAKFQRIRSPTARHSLPVASESGFSDSLSASDERLISG